MATTTNLSSLVINYLTQAQYDAAAQANTLDENQLYLTPAEGVITSETDPVFTASPAHGITSANITAWNGKATVSSVSVSLTVANWSSNSQTVSVTGVTASNNVIVSPAPSSIDNYVTSGIKCTAQASNSLTFTCTTTPSTAISVNVLILS